MYIAMGIAMLVAVSSIGYGFAFTASFTDQPTSSPTISSEPAYVTMGDWNTSYADGTGIGGASSYVSLKFHDPAANAEVHPEFTFTDISRDISSYDYITLTLDRNGDGHVDYTFYASVGDVNGSAVTSFRVIGTAVAVDSSGIWEGTINFQLHNGPSETLSTVMGSDAKLTVTAYHLVEADP